MASTRHMACEELKGIPGAGSRLRLYPHDPGHVEDDCVGVDGALFHS